MYNWSYDPSGLFRLTVSTISGDRRRTVTPVARTTSGRFGVARFTRFITRTWARFRFVPGLNEIDRVYVPSLVDWDVMYSVSSTPFTCCSTGAARLWATSALLAPG